MPDTDSFSLQYVEFGKVFTGEGASDFQLLDYSDAASANLVDPFRHPNIIDALGFPKLNETPFARSIGATSVALFSVANLGYFFAQIQRRSEGEGSANFRTNRPFNQYRFSFLSEERISSMFRKKKALYSSLLYQADIAKEVQQETPRLKTYFSPGERKASLITLEDIKFEPDVLDEAEIVVNAFVGQKKSGEERLSPVAIVSEMPLLKKLQVIEVAQYYLFPIAGVITFVLDHVSNQKSILLRYLDNILQIEGLVKKENIYKSRNRVPKTNYLDQARSINSDKLYSPMLEKYLSIFPFQIAFLLFEVIDNDNLVHSDRDFEILFANYYDEFVEHKSVLVSLLYKLRGRILASILSSNRILPFVIDDLVILMRSEFTFSDFLYHFFSIPQSDRTEYRRSILIDSFVDADINLLRGLDKQQLELLGKEVLLAIALAEGKEKQGKRPEVFKKILAFAKESPEIMDLVCQFAKFNVNQFDATLDALSSLPNNTLWKLGDFVAFLHGIADPEPLMFNKILRLLIAEAGYFNDYEDTAQFMQFLILGQAIYKKYFDLDPNQNIDNFGSVVSNLKPNLRSRVLEKCNKLAVKDATFAVWWIEAELFSLSPSQLTSVLNNYVRSIVSPPEEYLKLFPSELRYLIFGIPDINRELSIFQILKSRNTSLVSKQLLFVGLVYFWLVQNRDLSAEDVEVTINKYQNNLDLICALLMNYTTDPLILKKKLSSKSIDVLRMLSVHHDLKNRCLRDIHLYIEGDKETQKKSEKETNRQATIKVKKKAEQKKPTLLSLADSDLPPNIATIPVVNVEEEMERVERESIKPAIPCFELLLRGVLLATVLYLLFKFVLFK